MRNKLSLIMLAFTMFAITTGCRKEIKNAAPAVSSAQDAVKTTAYIDKMKAAYEQNKESVKWRDDQVDKKLQDYRASFEKLKQNHSQRQGSKGFSANTLAAKSIIRIPADYPTLQDAVDHAPQGATISVKGTVPASPLLNTSWFPSNSPVQSGNMLLLNGTDNYIEDNSVVIDPSLGFTVEGWININSLGTFNGLAAKTLNNIPAPFDIYTNPGDGTVNFLAGDGSNYFYASSSTGLATGSWYHIACVYDPGSSQIIIYINGELKATGGVDNNLIADNGSGFRIGSRSDNYYHTNGQEDEIRIWNVARTQAQIQAGMNTTVPANSAGLTAYYKLDENSGTSVLESVSNTNRATLYPGFVYNDVLVAVPGLVIQGEDGTSPIINGIGAKLVVSAGGVKVQNLTMNMAIALSAASNVTLQNNAISAKDPVLIDQSANCILKNNTVRAGDGSSWGIFAYGGSGHSIESNSSMTLPTNTVDPYSTLRTFSFVKISNSSGNKILNCNVNGSANQLFFIYYGFELDKLSKNNTISNCKAEYIYAGFAISGENNTVANCTASNNQEGFFDGYSAGKTNLFSNCIATNSFDAGFLFFGGTDNTLQGCTANNNGHGIVVFNFSSDVASWTITGSNASSNLTDGFLILTFNRRNVDAFNIEKNTVSNNAFTGINCGGPGKFAINKNTCTKNTADGIVLGDFTGTQNLISNTIQQNITQYNGAVGLELYNVNNSFVLKNVSTKNTGCDFRQTISSGNTLTGNQFGTDCPGL